MDGAFKPPPPDFSTTGIFSKPKNPPRAVILNSGRLFYFCNIFLKNYSSITKKQYICNQQ